MTERTDPHPDDNPLRGSVRFGFDGTRGVIEAPDCARFRTVLSAAAAGWKFGPATGDEGVTAARIEKRRGRYLIHDMRGQGRPIAASAVAAACAALADLSHFSTQEAPDRICLHGAGVVMAGRLVVFPSRSHAGKSTLVARLAQDGLTVFGDDVLPLSPDDETGIAAGMAPRLRLPLPDLASSSFREFVSRRRSVADRRYLYLGLADGQLAERGTGCPLGAVVLLIRREGEKSRIERATASAAMRALITQTVTRLPNAADAIVRTRRIVERLPTLALTYHDLDEAAALLGRFFDRWPLDVDHLPKALIEDEAPTAMRDASPTIGSEVAMRRSVTARLEEIDGELFLADGAGNAVHNLNAAGRAIWLLLEEPISPAEAAVSLCEVYPEVPGTIIRRDVDQLFRDLAEAGLIEQA